MFLCARCERKGNGKKILSVLFGLLSDKQLERGLIMKNLNKLYDELQSRKDFKILRTGFDGGMGMFSSGNLQGMTVIWSYGGGWEHVSIDGKKRMPEWNEMCMLKDMFFEEDECCVQYHPPKSEYVNNIPYCLHIWKPIEKYSGKLPVPDSLLVGVKGVELK